MRNTRKKVEKKRGIFTLTIITFLLLFGCNGNVTNEQNEENANDEQLHFSYKVIRNYKNKYEGLAIMVNKNGSIEYVAFEDDKDYNNYINEWLCALQIAEDLWRLDKSFSDTEISAYLEHVHCLPDCLNEPFYVNDEIRKTILESYYNSKEIELYEPKRAYGIHTYSYSLGRHFNIRVYVCLYKVDNEYCNVPTGTLAIFYDYFSTLMLN